MHYETLLLHLAKAAVRASGQRAPDGVRVKGVYCWGVATAMVVCDVQSQYKALYLNVALSLWLSG